MNNELEPLLTLPQAAELLFGDSGKVRALRTEIDKGHLKPAKIAGTFYVTVRELQEMVEKCRENPRERTSTGTKRNKPGSSGTAKPPSEQAAVAAKLKALKENLPSTSPQSGNRRHQSTAKIISLSQS